MKRQLQLHLRKNGGNFGSRKGETKMCEFEFVEGIHKDRDTNEFYVYVKIKNNKHKITFTSDSKDEIDLTTSSQNLTNKLLDPICLLEFYEQLFIKYPKERLRSLFTTQKK